MAKDKERTRTPRQRRRYQARSKVWLERNSVSHAPGKLEPFDGGYLCHYCEHWFKRKKITKDHIVPKSKGGLSEDWNYVWACRGCNAAKGAADPECICQTCTNAVEMHKKVRIAQGFDVDLEDVA